MVSSVQKDIDLSKLKMQLNVANFVNSLTIPILSVIHVISKFAVHAM